MSRVEQAIFPDTLQFTFPFLHPNGEPLFREMTDIALERFERMTEGLSSEAKELLRTIYRFIQKHGSARIAVQGHTHVLLPRTAQDLSMHERVDHCACMELMCRGWLKNNHSDFLPTRFVIICGRKLGW